MTVRFTVKCPRLASYPAKGISPDYMKDRLAEEKGKGIKGKIAVPKIAKEIDDQTVINERYNKRGIELGDILISKLTDVDITWCNDGCVVVSCTNTIAEVEQVLLDEGLEIQADKSDIKHKVKEVQVLLDEGLEIQADKSDIKHKVKEVSEGVSEEDIDEVFEPKTIGEKKKLKSKVVVNKHKVV